MTVWSPWSLVHGLGCRTRPLLGSGLPSPPEPWWSPDSNTHGAAPVHMLCPGSACFPALSPCILTRRPLSLAPIYREDTEARGRKDSCPVSPGSQALRLRFEHMSAAFGLLRTCTP